MDDVLEMEKPYLIKFYGHYWKMAQAGNVYAQQYVAQANYWGWGCAQNYDAFIKWDTLAAQNGSISSARRMILYYLSIKDYSTASSIYDINMRRNKNDVEKLFGVWFYGKTKEEFEDFCGKYQDVFGFIDALDGFKEWDSEEYSEKYLSDMESRGERRSVTNLFRAICYIFGFGVSADYNKAEGYLRGVNIDKGYGAAVSDCYNYICSIYEALLPTGHKGIIEFFKTGSYSGNSIIERTIYLLSDSPQYIEFYSRHTVLLALMGNKKCAAWLGKNIAQKSNRKEDYPYFYHDDKEALYWLSFVADYPGFADATVLAIDDIALNPQSSAYNYKYGKKLCSSVFTYIKFHSMYTDYGYDDNVTRTDYSEIARALVVNKAIEIIERINDSNELTSWQNICQPAWEYYYNCVQSGASLDEAYKYAVMSCVIYKRYEEAYELLVELQSKGCNVTRYLELCRYYMPELNRGQTDSTGCGCVIAGIVAFIIFVFIVI